MSNTLELGKMTEKEVNDFLDNEEISFKQHLSDVYECETAQLKEKVRFQQRIFEVIKARPDMTLSLTDRGLTVSQMWCIALKETECKYRKFIVTYKSEEEVYEEIK